MNIDATVPKISLEFHVKQTLKNVKAAHVKMVQHVMRLR